MLHLASEEIEKMVEEQENIVDDSSIPRNDESNIPGTRIEPLSDKESPEVEIAKEKEVEIAKEKEVEITQETEVEITQETPAVDIANREKGKNVEETRNSPIPTPIRSPRIHTNLVSSDTEKLQELTDTPYTTSSSSSPHKKLTKTNRLLSLFKTKPTRFKRYKSFFHELQGRYGYLFAHLRARFMPRKSFDTLADNLHDVMVETLPTIVDKHVKKQVMQQVPEQVRNQVPVYVAEGLILERQKAKEETERLIAKAILQEHGNIQAQISTQIENAIANVIPSQVDASVRNYMSGHILHVHPAQSQTSSIPEQQYQLYLAMKADPQLQQDIAIWLALQMKFERNTNSAKRQKTLEYEAYVSGESSSGQVFQEEQAPSTSGNQEQDDDFDFWTDSYASDDDEIPTKQVSQDIMEEVSLTIDEAKLRKMADEMLTTEDKGNSGPEKIVLSLYKFPTIIFNDDDIEERTSGWSGGCGGRCGGGVAAVEGAAGVWGDGDEGGGGVMVVGCHDGGGSKRWKVEESLNVTFDETPPPSKTLPLVDDDLDEEEAIRVTKKKNLENDIEDETLEIDEIVNIKESRNHPIENVIGNLNQRPFRSQAQYQSNFFCFISTIEPKNVNEALTDDSWIELSGCFDMSKPLPLQGLTGHLIIPMDFFFNNDLEYLKTGNAKRKCAASVTKTKATRYDLIGIEDMIPKLWSTVKEAYDKNVILSVIRLSIDKQSGYGYLKEIVVRRAYQKEYTFREADFSSLHLNDIEDMFLLYVQHKIHNLTGDEIVALVNALRMFTRSIVIQRRVEDVKLGVESYQKKLNITKPQTSYDGISFKEPYTIFYEPRGVVYLTKSKWKRLMRADELYKFSDGALKSVHDILHDMLNNFVLGYNQDMPKRAWTYKDQTRTDEMVKTIDNPLLERRIMRSFECYVGGRINEMDYRLRTHSDDGNPSSVNIKQHCGRCSGNENKLAQLRNLVQEIL
ncbi:hypothetical protein Tco_0711079 [Tanacetum coccineum]